MLNLLGPDFTDSDSSVDLRPVQTNINVSPAHVTQQLGDTSDSTWKESDDSAITNTKATQNVKVKGSKKRGNGAVASEDKFTAMIMDQMASQAARYDEDARHNKSMEKLEWLKMEQQRSKDISSKALIEIELKSKQIQYDKDLMELFHKMRNDFQWNYDVIAHALPAAVKYFPPLERVLYDGTEVLSINANDSSE
jgi:hypothetical protein